MLSPGAFAAIPVAFLPTHNPLLRRNIAYLLSNKITQLVLAYRRPPAISGDMKSQ
jgi:hypothetical protein